MRNESVCVCARLRAIFLEIQAIPHVNVMHTGESIGKKKKKHHQIKNKN